jgi:hypothetical protein
MKNTLSNFQLISVIDPTPEYEEKKNCYNAFALPTELKTGNQPKACFVTRQNIFEFENSLK